MQRLSRLRYEVKTTQFVDFSCVLHREFSLKRVRGQTIDMEQMITNQLDKNVNQVCAFGHHMYEIFHNIE